MGGKYCFNLINVIAVLSIVCTVGAFGLAVHINATYSYPERVAGYAAWYSSDDPTDPFEHKTTASGEPFNENAMTCAMRSYQFGGYYRVKNTKNGKSVIVRHNDWGGARTYGNRSLSDRIVDLTKAAFAEIGDLDDGVIPVEIERVK